MADSVALFMSLRTQWKWTGAGMGGAFRTGLDYTAITPAAAAIGIEVTPQVFSDIRTMEDEALSVWDKR